MSLGYDESGYCSDCYLYRKQHVQHEFEYRSMDWDRAHPLERQLDEMIRDRDTEMDDLRTALKETREDLEKKDTEVTILQHTILIMQDDEKFCWCETYFICPACLAASAAANPQPPHPDDVFDL